MATSFFKACTEVVRGKRISEWKKIRNAGLSTSVARNMSSMQREEPLKEGRCPAQAVTSNVSCLCSAKLKLPYSTISCWASHPVRAASLPYLPMGMHFYGQTRMMSTEKVETSEDQKDNTHENPDVQNSSAGKLDDTQEVQGRVKFKKPSKTAKFIMQILDKEAVNAVRKEREIPDIKPGYIVQLKVEVPENKRRVQIVKGIVIARRNAGLNTTFRIRRMVAGVGVESVYHLYSPNIKEITVLEKKKVRRAKLYYLREKMISIK
eukprot:TRINITY_DN31111_c0_g1_i1.p1 TRINITY_DN31111_c0_g1~~TRINITY_DN31111_c0_g1_i1.p1  ORF type:complete len:264 (-),score=37.67 TRINITY_DN31111_c0_g1_i1:348-1139(-)